ncbi:hypothetical protein ABB37_06714 [Leptomonas pyrrhocoris]|uniref:Stealth protein CR3 conserved region 3 domain-containing protein n=1 Tax=Leptomonas pyrrhocoris TaxID=157538 RepID=A0A0M9FXF7_LEPPY|nr:hypothetical protein ABB37_06707 [Leptomonas pyrrhocoris]XP_015656369.1 hypothetical protein ABB37_06707 [Leptomonas pyrrhocoris]XP_015656377.1 hypothetical protein ABB37_06714 [Leptomonas pyrrhocoris]XP_015656378.1 hypothetical protein ABB37_06714 [Leptomonas pyrrhocoris]KPA77929.1 hypothetical protein ABB37_06707 [Leptomonas pyrrhocoris]KPA77930.1 hypothetical protein ABB37_06707 [Leptomonas pyrrhocoris]KPA77938.1 hypothetical protein ABB37_06714 [Leptomonas pyrrhocoris]KPA77939.1 hypot|eukprot:XP_015656368.1 hypothetical protein ABB37_06707 [Leptomonas pyrrhocoris]
MNFLRPRGAQDNPKAARFEPVSGAIPILATGRFPSPRARRSPCSPSGNAVVHFCRAACGFLRRPRRLHLLRGYRWLEKRRLRCCAAIALFVVLLSTLFFLSFVAIFLTWERPWTQVLVRDYLSFLKGADLRARVPGASRPREPARLWGLTIAAVHPLAEPPPALARTAAQADNAVPSPLTARLEAKYADSLVIYTFANGTERNHVYRRLSLSYCGSHIQNIEAQLLLNGVVLDGKGTTEFCTTPMQQAKTNKEVLTMVDGRVETSITGRDRETDELRHSIRSLEKHVQWHRGRVVIVSPGHHPTWVDGARNFLAGVCGGAAVQALRSRGTHLRLTTVHQDALMVAHARLTVNTHSIEQQLWRVRNTTAVHVYMNDDYFVNRDVAITDLFNEYGGTIVRVESSLISSAYTANDTLPTWEDGVSHTNYIAIRDLDLQHEDDVSAHALQLLQQQTGDAVHVHADAIRSGAAPLPSFNAPSPKDAMWMIMDLLEGDHAANLTLPTAYSAEAVIAAYTSPSFGVVRPHFFATHAPFVYCTNMLRYLASRYQREYAQSMFLHRSRSSTDLYVPFLYNAFVMARPWVASPRFLPYLLFQREMERAMARRGGERVGVTERPDAAAAANLNDVPLQQARQKEMEEIKKTLSLNPIRLDNEDGCAPATMLVGEAENSCLFGRFTDDLNENSRYMRQIAEEKPMFFNVNSGLTTLTAADQLRAFLKTKFPQQIFLEKARASAGVVDPALTPLFSALMTLPVLAVVSFAEGVCPLVRSLSLAFAGHHRGRVHVRQPRHGLGEVDATLGEVRAELHYTPMSALPAVGCTFSSRVDVAVTKRGQSLVNLTLQAFANDGGFAVALPSTCGAGDGGAAGLRVHGFVIDAQTPHLPLRQVKHIPEALSMPGQTLALEDFRAMRVGPDDRDVVLVLAREDAAAKAVHWIDGASENDLLITFPLPLREYEEMEAMIKWVAWQP